MVADNLEHCNGGCFDVTLADSDFQDCWGTQTTAVWTAGVYMFWADDTRIVRSRFNSNGIRDATESNMAEGTILLEIAYPVSAQAILQLLVILGAFLTITGDYRGKRRWLTSA